MARYVVDAVEAFAPGARRIFDAGGREIAVFRLADRFVGVRNVCPHHGAPLCTHGITGTMVPSPPHTYQWGMEGQIIRCPWHGYEFNLEDGRSVADPEAMRVKVYDVVVEDGDVVLYV